jgi:hypothetical protein
MAATGKSKLAAGFGTRLVSEGKFREKRMAEFEIRAAAQPDLPRLTEIYNHYVLNTPVTFDIAP